MERKPSYDELEKRIFELEQEKERLKSMLASRSEQGMEDQEPLAGIEAQYQAQVNSSRELRISEKRFRALVDILPQLVSYVDRTWTYRFVNEAYESFFNLHAQDIVGRKLREVIGEEAMDEVESFVARALKGERLDYQRKVAYPGKSPRHMDVSLIPDAGSDGDVYGYYAVLHDITHLKESEEALRRSHQDLDLRQRIARMFLTSPNERLFSDVLDLLLEDFDCQYGYIGYIDDSGDLVCPSMTRDVWSRCDVRDKSIVFPRSGWGGTWGRSLLEKGTCMENSGLHPPEGHLPLNNALVVPLLAEQELEGQIALANKQGGFWSHDQQRLEALSNFLAPILRIYLEKEKSSANLAFHAKDLEEKNIALKVLLENRQAEKRTAADGILNRFDQLVFPYFEKAREAERFEHMQTLLEIIETNTRESLSNLTGTLPSAYWLLTAMEVQVADLIKAGRSSKEIASILKITPRSVFFHRTNIRRKLGLQNTKTNLRTHLVSAF